MLYIADRALQIQAVPLTSNEMHNHRHTISMSCNKPTPSETNSPNRVLDGPDVFYESDYVHDSGDHILFSRSLSKKSLITSSMSSSHGEDDFIYIKQPHGCLNIWRESHQICRSFTFPSSAARQLKRTLLFNHCKSFGHIFKSYMSSFWITRPLKTININNSSNIANKSLKIFTFEEISKATNLFSHGIQYSALLVEVFFFV